MGWMTGVGRGSGRTLEPAKETVWTIKGGSESLEAWGEGSFGEEEKVTGRKCLREAEGEPRASCWAWQVIRARVPEQGTAGPGCRGLCITGGEEVDAVLVWDSFQDICC